MSNQSAVTPEPEIREMPQQQGVKVDPQGVIDSLLRQNSKLTNELAHLEAYVNQQQQEMLVLQSRVQELEQGIRNATDTPALPEHNGRTTESTKSKKRKTNA